MEKRKIVFYLSIIVISLISITLYSTYAMFTTSVSSDTVINLDTTLNYEFDINSEKTFTVDSNTVLHFNAIVKNSMSGPIKYGIYHDYDLTSGSDVSIGEIVVDAQTTTTAPNATGIINQNSSKTVPIAIINNGQSPVTVSIGIATGYASNSLVYLPGTYALINTIDDDNIGNAACESNITYNEEDCYQENIGGILYTRCIVTTGQQVLNNLDTSGANPPSLPDGMIPIYYNGSSWVKADATNTNSTHKWYDYNNKLWANAVMVTSGTRTTYMNAAVGTNITEGDILAYYVWIPRYKYQLFNVGAVSMSPIQIQVTFQYGTSNKVTGNTNGSWLTHPAFTFGTEELTGIWVGKFETTGSATTPTIKPNIASLKGQNVSTQFTTGQKFGTSNYLTTTGVSQVDAHMMKNTEWGAVAYLKQSKYGLGTTDIGINNNNNESYLTGCGNIAGAASSSTCNQYNTTNGMKASTTGNITGIYDMSGGAYEYVMGVMKTSDDTALTYSFSDFTTSTLPLNSKYVNQYAYGTTQTDQTAYNRRILGDATGEVNGWYGDYAGFVGSSFPWFVRGGNYYFGSSAGVFSFDNYYGGASGAYSFRAVLVHGA